MDRSLNLQKKTYGATIKCVSSLTNNTRCYFEEITHIKMSNLVHEENASREHGLTVLSAAVFVAAEMAGSGILALPKAVVNTGWIGLVLLVIFCLNAAYSGSRLGDCWTILEERYPEFRSCTRNPYPMIASVAIGEWGSYLVSACIQLTLFGAGTVYLLLASSMIQELFSSWITVNACIWFLLFAALLCIPMWLGTPKDFWLVGIGALITTVFSCIFIFMQMSIDGFDRPAPRHETHSIKDFFLAFGTLLFAFGGASTFPTIQNDMFNRNQFHKSVKIAFAVIMILYLPIATFAYFIYGETLTVNIIESLTPSPFTQLAKVFMLVHLILAFIILINPVSQDLEEIFSIPNEFCVKRCLLRTFILCLMVFIGETIPKFNNILALVGGSTVTLVTFILPSYFYMKLCDQTEDRKIPLFLRTYMWELILIGIVGGVVSTYSAIETIIGDPLSRPCYWPAK